jgi:hypothetical protein
MTGSAKQSIKPRKGRMDCFAWLAMTCNPDTVIPGWSAGPDLRCAIAHRGISRFRVRCFASPRNDGVCSCSKHGFATPRRDAPELCKDLSPHRGRGECRVPVAPAASCAIVVIERTRVTTSTPERPAFPHAMVLTVYSALSPVTGLFCHRRQRIKFCLSPVGPTPLRELDASVGASGPHDFAVREQHLSSACR